jgi:hypothetical protein
VDEDGASFVHVGGRKVRLLLRTHFRVKLTRGQDIFTLLAYPPLIAPLTPPHSTPHKPRAAALSCPSPPLPVRALSSPRARRPRQTAGARGRPRRPRRASLVGLESQRSALARERTLPRMHAAPAPRLLLPSARAGRICIYA